MGIMEVMNPQKCFHVGIPTIQSLYMEIVQAQHSVCTNTFVFLIFGIATMSVEI